MPNLTEVTPPAAREAAKPASRLASLRWKLQVAFLLLLNPFGLYQFRGLCLPVLNCHGCPIAANGCPVGAFGNVLDLGVFPWLVVGSWGLVGALVGRLPCAWACPFGLLQDLLAKIPVPRWHPPRGMNASKYLVLVVMLPVAALVAGSGARWFFCGVCPAGTATGGLPAWISSGLAVPTIRLAFLAGFLALMLFVTRGFCRLVCPIGAGLAVCNRFSLFRLKLDRSACTRCGACRRACPIGEDPVAALNGEECIRCLSCEKCPQGVISLGVGESPSPPAEGAGA